MCSLSMYTYLIVLFTLPVYGIVNDCYDTSFSCKQYAHTKASDIIDDQRGKEGKLEGLSSHVYEERVNPDITLGYLTNQ